MFRCGQQIFFLAFLALYFGSPRTIRPVVLLIASYVFYAAWRPSFLALLILTTLVDYTTALVIDGSKSIVWRRLALVTALTINLGVLLAVKYLDFLLSNIVGVAGLAGIELTPLALNLVLPIGISFYTFQTMAYTLDIYLKRAAPAKSFLDFALFVTFFPQLVAGPIVRPTHLIPQFRLPRVASATQLQWGLALITLGLFNKIVLADGFLGPASDDVFGSDKMLHPLDAWLGTLAFSGQIFCDFAGYSTTAIGVALCLGFSLPDNFRFPYAAIGFSDFWRRWHISLSSWLRDYLYIPLGGNRKGPGRTYVNLMITMLLGGLWHGASWTFVVWGGLHGAYLAVERFLVARLGHQGVWRKWFARVLLALLTYFLVNITWVFFRAQDFATAWRMIDTMLTFEMDGDKVLSFFQITSVVSIITAMLCTHWWMRHRALANVAAAAPKWLLGTLWGVLIYLILITQGGSDAFIYFQF